VVLQGQRQALLDVLAEPRVDRGRVAAAEHQVHPPLRQVLQHRVLLRDAHRVVGRDQRRRRGYDEPLRGRRDVRQQRRRRGGEERRGVVLADREHVKPDLLGLLRDLHDRVDPLRLARRLPRYRIPGDVADREDPELHGLPPTELRYICVCIYLKQRGRRSIPAKRGCGRIGPWRASGGHGFHVERADMSTDHVDSLVIFGATGDLAKLETFPALVALVERGVLDVPVTGVAKSGWGLDQFRDYATPSLKTHNIDPGSPAAVKMLSLLRYVDGDLDDPATYAAMSQTMGPGQRALFYLEVPQGIFGRIAEG